MSNFTKDAFNLSQDIYNVGGDLEKLEADFNNFKITPEIYANNLYVFACKVSYLRALLQQWNNKAISSQTMRKN